MTETLPSLRRKMKSAHDLQSVVRTMKAMAGASIGPYERAVEALLDYSRTVELALAALFRHAPEPPPDRTPKAAQKIGAIIFGTDQGMVGQFNEHIAGFATKSLAQGSIVWVVGERVRVRVQDAGFTVATALSTPNSVAGITRLVSELLLAVEQQRERGAIDEVRLFHNRLRQRGAYDSVAKRLLPLDAEWRRDIESTPWPTRAIPEVIRGDDTTLAVFIREFLFVSIFRACAESLAAENARRFVAMQGAEKNIADLMNTLTLTYNSRRQAAIDEELFDLVAGYEALAGIDRKGFA
ncbi:F0F1 ATP synthase subunit gamma [Verrucomicrobiota bacterium sgz303538]